MKIVGFKRSALYLAAAAAMLCSTGANALSISRLTPPSELFRTAGNKPGPIVSRFIPGQRFDLAATVQPDSGATVTKVEFFVDGVSVGVASSLVTTGLVSGLAPNSAVAYLRAYSSNAPGVHTLTAVAHQSGGGSTTAEGNFEVIDIGAGTVNPVKNIIVFLGDGMGSGHRAAARIVQGGVSQGKVIQPLTMDTFPYSASVMTASLNSIVTDSAPGMQNYVTGNKSDNNQEGVWPDDTTAAFDNPRVEYLSEYLHRTRGTRTGIVTTADVFDATPASFAVHTANRGAGSGIVDQFFDERNSNGLHVLLGGGRKWFLPSPTNCNGGTGSCGSAGSPTTFNGSARTSSTDYVLPADLASAWGVPAGTLDANRNLIGDFTAAGFAYAATRTDLYSATNSKPLLGLFSLSNMNVALDKLDGRRGTSTVVNDYGFPDQPMLPEMTQKALDVLSYKNKNGFVLLVEGASIDKQAHNMDTDRAILDTIEFDKSIAVAKAFAEDNKNTLIIVTADHECSGFSVLGASTKTNSDMQSRAMSGGGSASIRDAQVGTYEAAKFPVYTSAADGYPQTMDPDYKLLVGFGANADRYEDWLANPVPLRDSQQPGNSVAPLNSYPNVPLDRDTSGGFLVTGQVAGTTAVHTANDIPLSAFGRMARNFHGTIDNTDVFFELARAGTGGSNNVNVEP